MFFMKVVICLTKIIGSVFVFLFLYILYGWAVASISLNESISAVERGDRAEIMYRDEKVCIVRCHSLKWFMLEFDCIELSNGKNYMLSYPDACCFKFIYENRRKDGNMAYESIENILDGFNNYYENSSAGKMLEYYLSQ